MKYIEVISYEWWLGIGLALVALIGFFRVRAQAVAKVERFSLAQCPPSGIIRQGGVIC